jgi:uncharacterized protein (DUF2141 family)
MPVDTRLLGLTGIETEEVLMRIVLALFLILFALPVNASELRITVEGIRSPHGTIMIGLYDSLESFTRAIELSDKDEFLNDPNRFAAVALRANAAKKSAVVFTNLDSGQYAIILFHDENGNGKLDTNALGNLMDSAIMCGGFSALQPSKKQSCRSTATKLFALS